MEKIKIYLEKGQKKTFAGAVDWPGYCRSGINEQTAIQSLIDFGPRYAQVLAGSGIDFQSIAVSGDLVVVERYIGNATTDFGAPDSILSTDHEPVDVSEFDFFQTLLRASWQAFDRLILAGRGKDLRTGPRGGGRNLDKILAHIIDADQAYLRRLAWIFSRDPDSPLDAELVRIRQAILDALKAGRNGELPAQGPRGGKIWPLRFFVRRLAWHTLDHAWEIEDRLEG